MDVQSDFEELLALFNAHKVKYLVVGGYALAFHGSPRTTGDIDIFVQASVSNAKRIMKALAKFGFGSVGLTQKDFEKEDKVVQLGVPPVRIDILTSLTGISWKSAYASKVKGMYGSVPVFYVGRKQFVVNKRATGRKKDAADLEALGE